MSLCPEHPDGPDADFSEDEERLFRRAPEVHLVGNGALDPASVDLRGWSFDRERYRDDPQDVLSERATELPLIFFTVVDRFDRVKQSERIIGRSLQVEARLPGEGHSPHNQFVAEVVHVPCLDNYAHTEIRVRPQGGSFQPGWPGPPSRPRKQLLKQRLAELLALLRDLG